MCNICSPDHKTGSVPKYEEEVTQRRKIMKEKRRAVPDAVFAGAAGVSRGHKKARKGTVFFPSESGSTSNQNASFSGHPLFRSTQWNELFNSFDPLNKTNLKNLVDQWEQMQHETLRKAQLLDSEIEHCEKQIQLIKEHAIEHRVRLNIRSN